MSTTFHPLTITRVHPETDRAVSLSFDVPQELRPQFQYTQGQYLTLRFMLNGQEERRAYSMSSSPVEEELVVTVKRLEGGLVSNHINDQLSAGDTVEVMVPDGRFYTDLDPDQRKDYYLFGAGSGITPLMSILKTILEKEPLSTVFLLYGNRSEDSIIFRDQLEQMGKRYADQLIVEHMLSQPIKKKEKGWSGLFKKAAISWAGKTGRIDAQAVAHFLEENPSRTGQCEYFICGPNPMINAVEKTLLEEQRVDAKHVHSERFTADEVDPEVAQNMGTDGARAKVLLEGKTIELTIPKGKTILDAMLDAKHDPPYSCTAGSCAACMAKVTKGSTEMEICFSLDPDEVEEGYILTCQAHPTSDEVELTFEV
ncbi:MAG: ferredoxin--NADP reductase [Bacteroidota bacterium]